MYAMHDIIAVTPELGDADWGFWPPETEIINLCNASLFKNLSLAHFTQRFAVAAEINEEFLAEREGKLEINVKRYGLTNGSLALSLESLDPDLTVLGSLQEVGLQMFEEETFAYDYIITEDAEFGDQFSFIVKLDNGFFEVRDTLTKTFGSVELPMDDPAENMDNWMLSQASTWGTTDEAAVSGETSITDSPFGTYSADQVNEMTLAEPIDLTEALGAELSFMAKWHIEDVIDYVVVEASTDGIDFVTLCGEHSTTGSIFQRFGEPIYDGEQAEWIMETISLDDFLGSEVYIRFALYSDAFFELDGMYIDDISLKVFGGEEETSNTIDIAGRDFTFRQFPNPASSSVNVVLDLSEIDYTTGEIQVYDMLGKLVQRIEIARAQGSFKINTRQLPAGIYSTSVLLDGALLQSKRLIIAK